jgi:RloB-like protein
VRVHYGLTTAEVVVADNTEGSAPISVVNFAERKGQQPGGYDKIFCVFDRNGHESFARAREKIKVIAGRKKTPLPIDEAISVPCFELWVLLHFERTDASFADCSAVSRRIRERHVVEYKKADATIARDLMQKLSDARQNAEWLEKRAENNEYNPYTSVYRALRYFEEIATM